MAKRESVLMIVPSFKPNIGGVEANLDDACEYLRRNGHKVFVCTYQPITTKAKGHRVERRKNLEVHRMQWFGYNLFPKLEPYPILEFLYLTPALFLYSLFFMMRRGKEVDVIHAHGLNSALIAKFLAKIFRKRSVATIWSVYELDKRPLMSRMVKYILSSFDAILPISKRSKRDLKLAGLPGSKMEVYYEWVDLKKFKPLNQKKCKRELKLNGEFVILFVGRLIAKKGMNVLLQVSSKVNPRINFVFVGDGPLADRIRKESETQPNVTFAGKVSEEDLIKYYNAADIFVIPSQYEECFGTVNLEALACGTPIIGSNRGGIREVIGSTVGVLVEPTVDNIAEKIEYFHRNRDELEKLKANCRRYVEERFSEKNMEIIQRSYQTRFDR